MKRNYLILSLLAGLLVVSSCHKDYIYGDITPNTDRIIVEFVDAKEAHGVALEYSSSQVTFDVGELQFMVRSKVQSDVTVTLGASNQVVDDYNAENGTSYSAVPFALFGFETTDITLTPTERKKKVRLRVKPSDISNGEWAIGLTINTVSQGEVSQIAGKLVILLSVKNKYDGVYHLKGFYTRTDNLAFNGPFETDVEMITTGANSVAMYWPDAGDWGQPFSNAGQLAYFTTIAPEVFFSTNDQVSSLNNYTGDPVAGPFMTPYPGANSRYVSGATPAIYLKYYYNTSPANRIFADTLIYTGPR